MTPPLETPPADAIYVGRHRIYLEPPDLFIVAVDGDISASDVLGIQAAIAAFEEDKEFVLVLVDASGFGVMAPRARKMATRPEAAPRMRGFAVYGTSFGQRVLIMLVVKAFALLKGDDGLPVASFETEAKARAWLDERRKALLAGR